MAANKKAKAKVSKKDRKSIPSGRAYIQATFNNTIISLTDPAGNVISSASAAAGFKGSRKGTPLQRRWRLPMQPIRPWSTDCAR